MVTPDDSPERERLETSRRPAGGAGALMPWAPSEIVDGDSLRYRGGPPQSSAGAGELLVGDFLDVVFLEVDLRVVFLVVFFAVDFFRGVFLMYLHSG